MHYCKKCILFEMMNGCFFFFLFSSSFQSYAALFWGMLDHSGDGVSSSSRPFRTVLCIYIYIYIIRDRRLNY